MPQPRILIVDDTHIIRQSMAELLELVGYQVATAVDGEAALAAMADAQFNLVLTDYRMPGMMGDDLIANINRCHPGVQTVLMSSDPDVRRIAQGCSAGGIFMKGDAPAKLRALLDSLLSAVQAAA